MCDNVSGESSDTHGSALLAIQHVTLEYVAGVCRFTQSAQNWA